MAKSSKPKEIVVVGSKVKDVSNPPAGLSVDVDDEWIATLTWDVDLLPSSDNPLPGFALSFFDDFEPFSTIALPSSMLSENPLGIAIGVNDNLPEVGDEVLVTFLVGDALNNQYEVNLHLIDPTGTAIGSLPSTTPLNLRLDGFASATLSLTEVGGQSPFATADILSLQSHIVPEPATIVLVVSMLGTLAIRRLFYRAESPGKGPDARRATT